MRKRCHNFYKEYTTYTNFSLNGVREDYNGSLILNPNSFYSCFDHLGKYNSSQYYYGYSISTPIFAHFKEAILSWEAKTPSGTWVEFEICPLIEGEWQRWYSLGVWLEQDTPFHRHSVKEQRDSQAVVNTDILEMKEESEGFKVKINLYSESKTISPVVYSLGICGSNREVDLHDADPLGIQKLLPVPELSQMLYLGGRRLCSPTSLAMVLKYWADLTGETSFNLSVPKISKMVWDSAYKGAGNWSFNMAFVSSLGLNAKVILLCSLSQIEYLIAQNIPVITSIRYKKEELKGAPLESTNGHLIVIRGFDINGNVWVNDPAGEANEKVKLLYNRYDFKKAWLHGSGGTTYLIYPKNQNLQWEDLIKE